MTKPQKWTRKPIRGSTAPRVSEHNNKYNDCKCRHSSECQPHRCPLSLIRGIYCSTFCCESKYYASLQHKSAHLTHLLAMQSCHIKHRTSLPLGLFFRWNHHKQEKTLQCYRSYNNKLNNKLKVWKSCVQQLFVFKRQSKILIFHTFFKWLPVRILRLFEAFIVFSFILSSYSTTNNSLKH